MTTNQTIAAATTVLALIGAGIFMQNMPPRELGGIEAAEIHIGCMASANSLMESGDLEFDESDRYIRYCTNKRTKDASKRWFQ